MFFLIVLVFSKQQLVAQTEYKEGYFINNEGNKISGLIKSFDWSDNPNSFRFKESVDSEVKSKKLEDVQEFGILSEAKYKRVIVKMEQSNLDMRDVNCNREFYFEQDTVWLKVIVEGQVTLYEYVQSNFTKFFYQIKDNDIEPLLYKKYRKEVHTQMAENNQ